MQQRYTLCLLLLCLAVQVQSQDAEPTTDDDSSANLGIGLGVGGGLLCIALCILAALCYRWNNETVGYENCTSSPKYSTTVPFEKPEQYNMLPSTVNLLENTAATTAGLGDILQLGGGGTTDYTKGDSLYKTAYQQALTQHMPPAHTLPLLGCSLPYESDGCFNNNTTYGQPLWGAPPLVALLPLSTGGGGGGGGLPYDTLAMTAYSSTAGGGFGGGVLGGTAPPLFPHPIMGPTTTSVPLGATSAVFGCSPLLHDTHHQPSSSVPHNIVVGEYQQQQQRGVQQQGEDTVIVQQHLQAQQGCTTMGGGEGNTQRQQEEDIWHPKRTIIDTFVTTSQTYETNVYRNATPETLGLVLQQPYGGIVGGTTLQQQQQHIQDVRTVDVEYEVPQHETEGLLVQEVTYNTDCHPTVTNTGGGACAHSQAPLVAGAIAVEQERMPTPTYTPHDSPHASLISPIDTHIPITHNQHTQPPLHREPPPVPLSPTSMSTPTRKRPTVTPPVPYYESPVQLPLRPLQPLQMEPCNLLTTGSSALPNSSQGMSSLTTSTSTISPLRHTYHEL